MVTQFRATMPRLRCRSLRLRVEREGGDVEGENDMDEDDGAEDEMMIDVLPSSLRFQLGRGKGKGYLNWVRNMVKNRLSSLTRSWTTTGRKTIPGSRRGSAASTIEQSHPHIVPTRG